MLDSELKITTISGEISSKDIGICHSHEHLFIKRGKPYEVDPSLVLDDFEKTKAEVQLFKVAGGTTIVDAQPIGCGRNSNWLERLSLETGIQIIASTGFHKLDFYQEHHWIFDQNYNELCALFIEEINNGMYCDGEEGWPEFKSSGRAGLIKTAANMQGAAGRYFQLFKAAAKASYETGTPIMSHTELGFNALEQIKLYTDLGLKENQLIICHLDRKMENEDYLLHVASTGVFLELDTIGRFNYHSDEQEVKLIKSLIDHGYEDQILLGLDTTNKRMKHYGGNIGLDHLLNTFLPLLKENGVSDQQIKKMMHNNPSLAFSKK
ncbi:phosphotriesterase family protein [Cytobacillus purgationiresistens]|uniref:Phosphotriesterase-related protein n=1 Tax=Cytobacillus purgationiresistens TaxID=863449 RepID=A0ABU0AIC2_9BACI|nr:hypothetical protein [Cytobacillus purgationiresistens]MDQ0271004.1 phosphotriesterase-related protein [Cytobacillus purgationiresistens]